MSIKCLGTCLCMHIRRAQLGCASSCGVRAAELPQHDKLEVIEGKMKPFY